MRMLICYIFGITVIKLLSMQRSYLGKTKVVMFRVHLVGQVTKCWAG